MERPYFKIKEIDGTESVFGRDVEFTCVQSKDWTQMTGTVTIVPFKDFKINAFISSTLTSQWIPCKDQDGNIAVSGLDGVAQLTIVNPLSASIVLKLEGASDAAGTGAATISKDVQDGDAITVRTPYYRWTLTTFTTTNFFETPEILALTVKRNVL
jgi:hypothetical protein